MIYSLLEPVFIGAIAMLLFAIVISHVMALATQLVGWLAGKND